MSEPKVSKTTSLPDHQLCKWKKDWVKAYLPELAKQLPGGGWICKKCARIAHEEDLLCKPIPINKLLSNP